MGPEPETRIQCSPLGFTGSGWRGNVGGPAARQEPWAPMGDTAAAARLWDGSEDLTGVRIS